VRLFRARQRVLKAFAKSEEQESQVDGSLGPAKNG